jgi:hypothetical protein
MLYTGGDLCRVQVLIQAGDVAQASFPPAPQSKQTPTLLLPWNRERRHTEGLYSSLPSHVYLNSEVAMALTNLIVSHIFHYPMVMFFEWPQILNLFHTNMDPHTEPAVCDSWYPVSPAGSHPQPQSFFLCLPPFHIPPEEVSVARCLSTGVTCHNV